MEIEVRKLCALKRFEGQFGFEYEPPADACLIPLCSICGKVKVNGDYCIEDDGRVWVDLNLSYKLAGQCSYCLEKAEKQIDYSTEVLFDTVKTDLSGKDDDHYIYDGIKINLKTAVDDAILISQPEILLCKEGCEGIDVTNK